MRVATIWKVMSILFLGWVGTGSPQVVQMINSTPVVHAVMFWMDGCPHCEIVIRQVLPDLETKYGSSLDIHLVEISSLEDIDRLYAIGETYGLQKSQIGVPLLIIDNQVLVGDQQIPEKLPGLVDQYLLTGGVGVPDIPGGFPGDAQAQGLPTMQPLPTLANATELNQPISSTPKYSGFTLAWIIMVGMLLSLGYVVLLLVRAFQEKPLLHQPGWMDYLVPILSLFGMFAAGYLLYVETNPVQAICGPVGNCNAVQSSPYSRLFGILPVGLVGLLGYLAVLAVWLWKRLRSDRLAEMAPMAIMGMALFGVLFSIYLTYLELFVIKAVCIWCLSSAVIITLLFVFSAPSAVEDFAASND